MKLAQLLVKLGLLHGGDQAPAARAPAPPAPVERRVVKLEELRASAGEAREKALGLDLGVEDVYREAGLGPPPVPLESLHGLGGSQVAAVLKGVPAREVLMAALQRDAALDRYEETLLERVAAFEEEDRRAAERLEEEARRLMDRSLELKKRSVEVRTRLEVWRARKREAEAELERLGEVLGPLAGAAPPS